MAQVSVTINGRQFRMACEDGQEEHLTALAAQLEERIVDMRGRVGEIGDNRLTVMAAITITDDLDEAKVRIAKLEGELARFESARAEAARRSNATQAALVNAFDSAAARIEGIAKKLNQPG